MSTDDNRNKNNNQLEVWGNYKPIPLDGDLLDLENRIKICESKLEFVQSEQFRLAFEKLHSVENN